MTSPGFDPAAYIGQEGAYNEKDSPPRRMPRLCRVPIRTSSTRTGRARRGSPASPIPRLRTRCQSRTRDLDTPDRSSPCAGAGLIWAVACPSRRASQRGSAGSITAPACGYFSP